MEALLTSTISVAIAEIGDKTQLLALLLICRFRKPWPIIAGMLAATLLNHAGAAWIGEFISRWMVSIHRNSIDTGKMRRSSLDPTFLLA